MAPPSAPSTHVPDVQGLIAPPGPTNAQATAVAVGRVSEMDISEGEFYSTGPAFWSYSFRKDDVCRPVSAVRNDEGKDLFRKSKAESLAAAPPPHLKEKPQTQPNRSSSSSSSFPFSSFSGQFGPHHQNSNNGFSVPSGITTADGLVVESTTEGGGGGGIGRGGQIPDLVMYGAPDFNAMIAAAMYDSIRDNYDYILQTQYGAGLDKTGNLWNGMGGVPVMQQKKGKGNNGHAPSTALAAQQNRIPDMIPAFQQHQEFSSSSSLSSSLSSSAGEECTTKTGQNSRKSYWPPQPQLYPTAIGSPSSAFPAPKASEGMTMKKASGGNGVGGDGVGGDGIASDMANYVLSFFGRSNMATY